MVKGTGVWGYGVPNMGTYHFIYLLELFDLVKLRRCERLGAPELRCVTGHGGSKFWFFVPQLEVKKKSCLRASEIMSEASQLRKKTHAKTGLIAWACKACACSRSHCKPWIQGLRPLLLIPARSKCDFFRYPLVNLARIFTFVPGRHMHWSDHPHKESRRDSLWKRMVVIWRLLEWIPLH